MKKMCSLSRLFAFIALFSASTALRAEDAPTLPPPNAAAAQNPADTGATPAAVVAPPTIVAPAAPAVAPAPGTTVVAPPSNALPTEIEPRAEYGQYAGIINFPAGIDLSTISDVIIQAASNRGWSVLSHANGKIILTNQSGNWTSQLTLLWTPDKIVIYSNSTKNGKPKLPVGWIDNLRKDILRVLNPGAPASAKKRK